jgi:acetoacetyl-CoA synthetase
LQEKIVNTLNPVLWTPSAQRIAEANITRFMREVQARHGVECADYPALHRWSLADPESFWRELWRFGEVIAQDQGERAVVDAHRMPGAKFFPDARLNFAENLLRRRDDADALVFWGEDKARRRLSFRELHEQVSRVAQALKALGVAPGDRVAGYMPNMPETIVAMLATVSLGGIWTSASPDFGIQGVLDRFGQVEPKVVFAPDGYWYNGKRVDVLSKLRDVVAQLPSLLRVVVVPYLEDAPVLDGIANAATFGDFMAPHAAGEIAYAQMPFSHPLYIMYSSGTTGVPKCIVHSAGGTLLQHLKEHLLHGDLRRDDRLFYFTTCGWMMWNWLVSGLAAGATLLLFDGSPFAARGRVLLDLADAERMTHFGTSAKYIDALKKLDLDVKSEYRLDHVRVMFSTGSPLAPESFDYVYQGIKSDILLASIAGGTDIVSCFVLGCPILPVRRGEIQCRGLGMAVEAWNDEGKPVPAGSGQRGELVCVQPFPSMPVGFWNDPNGAKYHAAYFEKYPNVWCHGDYVEITASDGMIIHGRSDAVLNPGGVRIGTAEIYRQVEQLPEVLESLVIGQDWDNDVRVVLFVRLAENVSLDEALIQKIKTRIRNNTTPRHVPAKVLQVPDIPRTRSGKIVELAVRNAVHGRPVKNVEALANPESLDYYRNRTELGS